MEDEAKAMYSEFHAVGSKFSRQPTEPMIGFCQRRTRAYNLLRELDAERANLSKEMLGDMLLDNAGINI